MAVPPDFDIRSESDKVMIAMGFLATLKLSEILETVEMAHTLGPFIDPTKYRDALQRDDLTRLAKLARALQEPVRIYNDEIAPRIGVAV